MNIEEAKQLKPGDIVHVLVELVKRDGDMPDHWCGKTSFESLYLCPEDICGVAEIPRRKFRKGDIIRTLCGGTIYEVQSDEASFVSVNYRGEQKQLDVSHIKLVCKVEDRQDRKGGEV